MWDGELVPLGQDAPQKDYFWKNYYYNDFYLLYRHKKQCFETMDAWVDAVDITAPKLLPADAYNTVVDALVSQPINR